MGKVVDMPQNCIPQTWSDFGCCAKYSLLL